MENVLTAVIVIFLFLFAGYTLSESLIGSQETLASAELARDERLAERTSTSLYVTDAITRAEGTEVQISLRNDGTTKLYDYDQWDVIVQYVNTSDSFVINWTPYTSFGLLANQWTVEAIIVDDQNEGYEPGILNPGETAIVVIALAQEVQQDTLLNVVISTDTAKTITQSFPRNAEASLDVHQAMRIAEHTTDTISADILAASDPDDDTVQFAVNTAPTEGTLSLTTFTQQDINAGLVTYSHAGTGNDAFTFTITDGKDTSDDYTFHVFISEAPVLIANSQLNTTVSGTGAIYNTMLRTDDSDDSSDELVYSVISGLTQGYLSLGTTFRQSDIDAGLLTYTHTGLNSDQFSFTVTDGETVIGPYVYIIQVS